MTNLFRIECFANQSCPTMGWIYLIYWYPWSTNLPSARVKATYKIGDCSTKLFQTLLVVAREDWFPPCRFLYFSARYPRSSKGFSLERHQRIGVFNPSRSKPQHQNHTYWNCKPFALWMVMMLMAFNWLTIDGLLCFVYFHQSRNEAKSFFQTQRTLAPQKSL